MLAEVWHGTVWYDMVEHVQFQFLHTQLVEPSFTYVRLEYPEYPSDRCGSGPTSSERVGPTSIVAPTLLLPSPTRALLITALAGEGLGDP